MLSEIQTPPSASSQRRREMLLSAPARTLTPPGDGSFLPPSRPNKPAQAFPPFVCLSSSSQSTTTTAPVTQSGATVVTTTIAVSSAPGSTSPVVKKRKRYRKAYPGESRGLAEEMRFVAMRLRNDEKVREIEEKETWKPSTQGFLKYLVDTNLVFETLENTVDQSEDVACKKSKQSDCSFDFFSS